MDEVGAPAVTSELRSAGSAGDVAPACEPRRNLRTITGLLSSLSFFVGSFLIGVLLTPFLVRKLGVDAYGLIPLSFSIAAYFALATQVISAIVNQKLIANEHNPRDFNHYFFVFFFLCAGIAALLVLVIVELRNPIVSSLNVPEALWPGASLLLIASMVNVALFLLGTPVSAVIYAVRGVDLINLARLLELIVHARDDRALVRADRALARFRRLRLDERGGGGDRMYRSGGSVPTPIAASGSSSECCGDPEIDVQPGSRRRSDSGGEPCLHQHRTDHSQRMVRT